jgi:hypothetical protein
MKTTFFPSLFALLVVGFAVGCDSGSDSSSDQANQTPSDAGSDTATPPEPAPVRTLVTRSLLPGAPQNLILDWTFREAGWGKFLSLYEGAFSQYTVPSRVLGPTPAGVTAAVGIFRDSNATDEKSRGIVSICSLLGGKGPFLAKVWVSKSNVEGAPLEFAEDPLEFRAAITTGGLPEGKAYELARKSSTKIGERTWYLYEARVEADLPTSFFNLRFGRKGGQFQVQAPEVVPLGLLPAGDTTKSFTFATAPRLVDAVELAAMREYAKLPVQLGLPAPEKGLGGKPH